MIFKGKKFTKNSNIVVLPSHDNNGFLMSYMKDENHITFGKVTKVGMNKKGAVKTNNHWLGGMKDQESVYAIPIKVKGYSLTNMMYSEDGKVYLFKDGKCYVAKQIPSL